MDKVDCLDIGKKVAACYSIPRLGFTDNLFATMELRAIGIKVAKSPGVYWDQSLTNVLEVFIERGFEFALTLDYDTIFKAPDVLTMYALMQTNPYADAISPVQMRREELNVLVGKRGPDGQPVASLVIDDFKRQEMTRVHIAHFGCTMIRLSALKDLPKPWFGGIPDKNGEWHDGHIDSDIAFWHKWDECGRSLYQANRVVVGHLQLMLSLPDKNLAPIHQTIGEYEEKGMPAGVWT
jgi:hypothetical protein